MDTTQNLSNVKRSYLATGLFLLCLIALAACMVLGLRAVRQHTSAQRGIVYQALPTLSVPDAAGYGVNVTLEQYSDADRAKTLSRVRSAGFTWVRQRFPWGDIEPQPAQFDWEPWDRIIAQVQEQGLHLIAVLDTSPTWAREPRDHDNSNAPPQYVTTYGLFVRAFAQRYAGQISCYQVWDQPNIAPHWGECYADPAAYVRLLRVASAEIKHANPQALVLSAALAPNVETGGPNLSDVLFLRGMYDAGARGLFDVLGAKAYGFWSGPDDRRVDPTVLNLSRLILLREEMVRRGDTSTPIWAVEFGWNALPTDWRGQPAPWGSDDASKQADRTLRAVQRMRSEWAWLGLLCAPNLQPAVTQDDPQWGFALLSVDSVPTFWYHTWQTVLSTPVTQQRPTSVDYYGRLISLTLAACVAVGLLAWSWPRARWGPWLARLARAFLVLSEPVQWLLVGLLLLTYQFAPSTAVALLALLVAGWLIHLRLDIGLSYLVFSIPFFLFPRQVWGKGFSMVEILTIICVTSWLLTWLRRAVLEFGWPAMPGVVIQRSVEWLRTCTSLDWAAWTFVLLGALSLFVSSNRGVSLREFRVIVFEPVAFYWLLRQLRLNRRQLLHLVDALLLAGVAVAWIGLYQYVSHGDVIVTEGVQRVRAVYASPNNLSLLLDRVIPLALAVLVVGQGLRRRFYGLALLPLMACLFLTFSRGGWLLGLPAALLTVGFLRGRRATLIALAVVVVCGLALLPLAGTQRLSSLFDLEQGTTLRRVELWTAALAMIRDHPLTGVGLDNFLYQYPNYMLSEAWQEPFLSHPHNIVLDYWTRLGIGGVVLLVWLMVAFFKLASRLYRLLPDSNERAIILGWMACMVAILAHGLIDHSYFLVDLAFIFFLDLGWMRSTEAASDHAIQIMPQPRSDG